MILMSNTGLANKLVHIFPYHLMEKYKLFDQPNNLGLQHTPSPARLLGEPLRVPGERVH